ncbi:MAG: hypothetical protein GX163_10065 [Bacteroidetes bacterium]|jgi:hypothetical protein|nr:hypothetical protein [Bacteroidota bacterium]
MANIRNLKKDINYVLGDIIDAVVIWQMTNPEENTQKGEEIINEAVETFDDLILKVNQKGVANKKMHFKQINQDLETRAIAMIEKINKL